MRTAAKPTMISSRRWADDDDRMLLTMAGYKTARFIAKALHRSDSAVRYRLAVLGKSSRVHLEGYARRTLAQELHLGSRTIQRLIAEGLLEVRDPRITRKSLDDAYKTGRLTRPLNDQRFTTEEPALSPREEEDAGTPSKDSISVARRDSSKLPRSCRAKRIWADLARQLRVDAGAIEHLVFIGVLKLYDPRITEQSLTRFCARYLNGLCKLSEDQLRTFIAGKTMPPEFDRKRPSPDGSVPFVHSGHEFRILDHVGKVRKVGRNYVTQCPSCAEAGQDRSGDNLAISIEDPQKYLCWAGCTREMIRRAVGCPIPARQSA